MSVVTEFIQGVVDTAIREILRKPGGTRKRAGRRRALTATERLRRIGKLIKPAKRQVSRKRTTRARSKVKRRAR